MTIFHDKPHNLHIICDSCTNSIFDMDIDDGIDQLRMIHTHCASCCGSIDNSISNTRKALNDSLHEVLMLKDKEYKKLAEGKESTLEDRIWWLKQVLQTYEYDIKKRKEED